jgi:hypothetical protein
MLGKRLLIGMLSANHRLEEGLCWAKVASFRQLLSGDAYDRIVEGTASRRPEKSGVNVGEDPAVGGHH